MNQKSLLKDFYSKETPTKDIFHLILLSDAVISSSSVGLSSYSELTLR